MLRVQNISFGYKNDKIISNISFEAQPGEYIAIIGESGSGKSTLLNLLYGTFDLESGSIFWKSEQILGPAFNLVIGYDFMKYVPQEFDLMPYTTVEENVGEFLSNFFLEEKQSRIDELLEVVELQEFSKTKVKLLSGGQKQRVALAKALAKQPDILLLDEPFSNIDSFKKRSLRRNLFGYLKTNNITCITATHDKNDVLGFADRILVLNDCEILANETPEILYNNPKVPLIASFFDEFNVIDGKIVYAHQLKLIEDSALTATVVNNYFKGHYYMIEATSGGQKLFFNNASPIKSGSLVSVGFSE